MSKTASAGAFIQSRHNSIPRNIEHRVRGFARRHHGRDRYCAAARRALPGQSYPRSKRSSSAATLGVARRGHHLCHRCRRTRLEVPACSRRAIAPRSVNELNSLDRFPVSLHSAAGHAPERLVEQLVYRPEVIEDQRPVEGRAQRRPPSCSEPPLARLRAPPSRCGRAYRTLFDLGVMRPSSSVRRRSTHSRDRTSRAMRHTSPGASRRAGRTAPRTARSPAP